MTSETAIPNSTAGVPTGRDRASRACLGLLILLAVGYSVEVIAVRQSMYSDPAVGFLVWRSMQMGGSLNVLVEPDANVIGSDRQYFMTTWAPGQYLIPGLLSLLGPPLGLATALTTVTAIWTGILGLYFLCRRLGFSERIALLSCLLIATTRATTRDLGIYSGGEPLLLGFFPWCLLAVLRYPLLPWRALPLFLILFLTGFGLKLSFPVVATAMLAGMVATRQRSGEPWLGMAIRAAVLLAAYVGATVLVFEIYGRPAHMVDSIPAPDYTRVLFPVAGPLLGTTSTDDLLHRLMNHPSAADPLDFRNSLGFMVGLAVASVVVTAGVIRSSRNATYQGILIGFTAVYLAAFWLFFLSNAAVSYEGRHFRPLGFLLIPGALSWVARWPVSGRVVVTVVIVGLSAYGLASFANHTVQNLRKPLGRSGFRLEAIDATGVPVLWQLDSPEATVLVPSLDQPLEFKQARVIATQADYLDSQGLASHQYTGRVPGLVVVLPAKFWESGKTTLVLKAFQSYDPERWSVERIGEVLVFRPNDGP